MQQTFHLHLVSDATGETLSTVARACVAQFDGVDVIEHVWSLVRTPGQMQRVISGIAVHPGVVLFTVVDPALRESLEQGCAAEGVPCTFVLQPVMTTLINYLGRPPGGRPGSQHELNSDYFRRIEAMEFTLAHDDGQGLSTLARADVIVLGVSRTSKTPTCLYLANRGLRAANVPLVPGIAPPNVLTSLQGPVIVGLTSDAAHLVQIRRNRIKQYGDAAQETEYIEFDEVKRELSEARRLFLSNGWPVIDVTRRSIEETAAAIYQLHANRVASRQMAAAPDMSEPQFLPVEPLP